MWLQSPSLSWLLLNSCTWLRPLSQNLLVCGCAYLSLYLPCMSHKTFTWISLPHSLPNLVLCTFTSVAGTTVHLVLKLRSWKSSCLLFFISVLLHLPQFLVIYPLISTSVYHSLPSFPLKPSLYHLLSVQNKHSLNWLTYIKSCSHHNPSSTQERHRSTLLYFLFFLMQLKKTELTLLTLLQLLRNSTS